MEMEERFDSGCEVNLEDWLWNLWDDSGLEKIKCFVLPSLIEGCIMGSSKIPPQNKDFQESKQFWLHKNGLEFPKDCFYVNVQFTTYEEKYKAWFPSSLVFRGSGLMPVAHTIRASKVLHTLDNFKTCIAEWNFFDGGTPNFESTGQVNSSLEVSTWVTAKDILGPHCSIENHIDQKCALGDCTLSSLTIAISSLEEVEPDKLFSPAIATEGRQSILKAPTFARTKPSAEILQKKKKGLKLKARIPHLGEKVRM
ncbi:hypothetical protein SUGI_1078300 [Cryptomeria japonica]|nr:hypothetical protein SUGI_1078300 [Cryptomeria japonica]